MQCNLFVKVFGYSLQSVKGNESQLQENQCNFAAVLVCGVYVCTKTKYF